MEIADRIAANNCNSHSDGELKQGGHTFQNGEYKVRKVLHKVPAGPNTRCEFTTLHKIGV